MFSYAPELRLVEVFKTNVEEHEESLMLSDQLRMRFPYSRVSFDLEDCDRVLRVEAATVCIHIVCEVLERYGYRCEML